MRSMQLFAPGRRLELVDAGPRSPGTGEILVRVRACGVCRTDLHIIDGELPALPGPDVPGHQIGGVFEQPGRGLRGFGGGERVGVPWLGWTCDRCAYCLSGRENLCDGARFTGYHVP